MKYGHGCCNASSSSEWLCVELPKLRRVLNGWWAECIYTTVGKWMLDYFRTSWLRIFLTPAVIRSCLIYYYGSLVCCSTCLWSVTICFIHGLPWLGFCDGNTLIWPVVLELYHHGAVVSYGKSYYEECFKITERLKSVFGYYNCIKN